MWKHVDLKQAGPLRSSFDQLVLHRLLQDGVIHYLRFLSRLVSGTNKLSFCRRCTHFWQAFRAVCRNGLCFGLGLIGIGLSFFSLRLLRSVDRFVLKQFFQECLGLFEIQTSRLSQLLSRGSFASILLTQFLQHSVEVGHCKNWLPSQSANLTSRYVQSWGKQPHFDHDAANLHVNTKCSSFMWKFCLKIGKIQPRNFPGVFPPIWGVFPPKSRKIPGHHRCQIQALHFTLPMPCHTMSHPSREFLYCGGQHIFPSIRWLKWLWFSYVVDGCHDIRLGFTYGENTAWIFNLLGAQHLPKGQLETMWSPVVWSRSVSNMFNLTRHVLEEFQVRFGSQIFTFGSKRAFRQCLSHTHTWQKQSTWKVYSYKRLPAIPAHFKLEMGNVAPKSFMIRPQFKAKQNEKPHFNLRKGRQMLLPRNWLAFKMSLLPDQVHEPSAFLFLLVNLFPAKDARISFERCPAWALSLSSIMESLL